MKLPGASQPARGVIVLVMIAAWFVASDHCALAGVLMRVASNPSAEEHCAGHSQPEKKPSSNDSPCCKSLVATTAAAKISAGYDLSVFAFQPYAEAELAGLVRRFETPCLALDTGPPELRTFAESVLQRSLLAHAPPCLS
ncbi:MAG: hypothetical protein ACR2MW_05675 [Chthoniobacterales bacterium]